MFKDGLLKGKNILITGGGTGLGKEIAQKYLQLGADLWIAGRRGGVLDATAKECVVVTDRAPRPDCARSRSVAARIVASTCAAAG